MNYYSYLFCFVCFVVTCLLYSQPVDGDNASRRAFFPKPKQEVELKIKLPDFYGNNHGHI